MTILERYIFRRVLTLSIGALLSLLLVIWITQALQRINIVTTTAAAAGKVMWLAVLMVPNLAMGILPFALLIGAIQALNALNADSERAAISAAGGSMRILGRPVLLLSALFTLVMLIDANIVSPAAQRTFYRGMSQVNADVITLFLKEGRFEEVQKGLYLSVGSVRGSTVRGLFISDRRDPVMDLTYLAEEGRIIENGDEAYLLLYNGQLHRRKVGESAVSIIQFQTYAFDLSDLRGDHGGTWTRTSERSTAELLSPDPNDPQYRARPGSFAEELHERFSEWLYCVAFALWALVVAGQPRTNRQKTSQALTLGLGGAMGLRALGFVVTSVAGRNDLFVYALYALPLASIVSSIILLKTGKDIGEIRSVRIATDRILAFGALLRRAVPLGGRSRRGASERS
ncbi:LptF/LptG family permease [Consotaella salsifontis]|uniref:Lipopolysaccharide export system permease protein n=1 Tax=Consotaella salsifontis TaxID=1365950 RepID=A0A1T4LLG7_9HYPH|nr:LptF/LptG family permease [Consotaella salsifontis]SJZ55427.1 lipopolysaccharide export system permease protein [Consotaella salsifontis]